MTDQEPVTSPEMSEAPKALAADEGFNSNDANKTAASVEEPKKQLPIAFNNEANIYWLKEDGTTESADTCLRSTDSMLKFLAAKVDKDHDLLTRKIRIVVRGNERMPDGKPGADFVGTVAEDTVAAVAAKLKQSIIPAQYVVAEFQRLCEYMTERSELRGALMTFVFDEARVGGFGYLTSLAKIDATDVVMLGETALNQVNLYKTEMKKKDPDVKFPSDDDGKGLILPSRFNK